MEINYISPWYELDGLYCCHALCDFEYLQTIKKYPRNRPCGDEDDEGCGYHSVDMKNAAKHKMELVKSFEENGFRATLKELKVAVLNGVNYKHDGQHTIAGVKEINKDELKSNKFRLFLIDYKDDKKRLEEDLNILNNDTKKFTPSDYAYTGTDERLSVAMVETAEYLSITTRYALILILGNLTQKLFSGKTLDDAKRNWEIIRETLHRIYVYFESIDADAIANTFRSGDAFIVLAELIADICHKRYLSYKIAKMSEEDALNRVKANCDLLVEHFCGIPPLEMMNMLNAVKGNRKKAYKEVIKRFLLSKNSKYVSKKIAQHSRNLNGTELKSILEEWSKEGINN